MSFDALDAKTKEYILWWITSIATSVVLCSMIFVVFGGYFMNVHDRITTSSIRIELLEQRMYALTRELQDVQKRSTVQKIQIVPSPAPEPEPKLIELPAIPPGVDVKDPPPISTVPPPGAKP